MHRLFTVFAATLFTSTLATAALAESDMEQALADGAKKLTADEIVDRLAGKTVTFEAAATGDRFLVYYDEANGYLVRPVDGEDVTEGFYAASLADHVCLGRKADAPIRLRCVNVLSIEGVMHKFELDGSLRGRIVEEVEGDIT